MPHWVLQMFAEYFTEVFFLIIEKCFQLSKELITLGCANAERENFSKMGWMWQEWWAWSIEWEYFIHLISAVMFLSHVLSEPLLHPCQVLSAGNFKQEPKFGRHVWACHLRNNREWSRNEDLLPNHFGKPQSECF